MALAALITRGWLIYDWRQVQPRIAESSQIFKASQYVRWFNRQLLAVDSKGDYSFSILVGDELNTTLTPMTFRKAGFNGVMANVATNRAAPHRTLFPHLGTSAARDRGSGRSQSQRHQSGRGPQRSGPCSRA